MIESIENLEDMKVAAFVLSVDSLKILCLLWSGLWFFSFCRGSDGFSWAAGTHCKGVGIHGGSQAGDIQPIQELSAHPC